MLSLSWGYVDGSMGRAATLLLMQGNVEPALAEALLEDLITRRLVIELKGERIRSRFSETVRLLSRLRQLFEGRPWFGAPKLVADFRVDLRQRRYPLRNCPAARIGTKVKANVVPASLRTKLWEALAEQPELMLAGFQERSIGRLLNLEGDSGTIVTAGTGSGKTLAFYLPALVRIGEKVELGQYWVKALAIYPRVELLKDQLAEAFRRARSVDATLKAEGKRPIKVGAYFGSTPNSASEENIRKKKWQERRGAFVCPWMPCPDCAGELLWHVKDIKLQHERLICGRTECGTEVPEEQLVLTRKRLAASPPDILFTTTEMLNQRMSDLETRCLFGLGQPFGRRPIFALLDEVHTYVGSSGAQSALVLRRWRHLVNGPVIWCGLSATLQEASRFFSDLTGVNLDRVTEVTPLESEMVSEGAEYQLVLKGDPLLQASLLSTTIQAAMLLGRIMDTAEHSVSDGVFGRRAFVFTDNLDVINRLFDNLRDAEGYTIFGQPSERKVPLAALRGAAPAVDQKRDADGQRWRLPELIGRHLATRLVVGRTSSQDVGVLANADVVVATASLEVGYNDDQVGAVIQHKAPRSMASFLQRKGRAGRARGMRPVTVTILSDYGRDRLAFQAYEHLFDPTLPPQHLPIKNEYVLRMQAVYALIDWISIAAVGSRGNAWMWNLLSQPSSTTSAAVKTKVGERLKKLARGDLDVLGSLREHLKRALQIQDQTVDSILWSAPRPLMLEAVPTLVRRYFRNWELARPGHGPKQDLLVPYHPLPDFIPRNLFSDLNLPEVQVLIPAATVRHEARAEGMPIVQALQQLAPGRVTRRFAFERGGLSHWAPIAFDGAFQQIEVSSYAAKHEFLGNFSGQDADGERCNFAVYRPWEIAVVEVPKTVLASSNASLVWFSGFEPRGPVLAVDVPPRSAWFSFVGHVGFYLHRFRGGVAIRRFAHQALATLRRQTGETLIDVRFCGADGQSAALGFEIEVDAFYVDFKLPALADLNALVLPIELQASNRAAYLRYRLLSTKKLPPEINSLQREWMYQIFFCSAVERALIDGVTVGTAANSLLVDQPLVQFAQVMRTLFVLQESEENDEDPDLVAEAESDSVERRVSRLEARLTNSLGREDVLAFLAELAPEFDRPDAGAFALWLRSTIHETLSESLLQACIDTAPRHAATDTLVSDVEVDAEKDIARVWISETTVGGGGVVQAFADAFASEPRSLFRAIESAIAPTDLEMTSHGLRRFLISACEDSAIAALVAQLRGSTDHVVNHRLREQLYAGLAQKGIDMSHSLSVSLNARLLRPGTSHALDLLLRRLLDAWEGLEHRFGLAIGLREFCFIALCLPNVKDEMTVLVTQASGASAQNADLIAILSGMLWPRGMEIRSRTLQSYNPFRARRVTDPAIIRHVLLSPGMATVELERSDWYEVLVLQIAQSGLVQLVVHQGSETLMRSAIMRVIRAPVDVGYLQFFPFVERVEREETITRITFGMREQV